MTQVTLASSYPPLPGTSKVRPEHLRRKAVVYIRQSTMAQVRGNLESQRRQYGLVDQVASLGWSRGQIEIIDEDQGRSGSQSQERPGFQRLVSEVVLGHIGIIVGLETSRLARNNEDWHHLLNICAVVDTLIADVESIYDLRLRNDRAFLGFKGEMNQWELDNLHSRLNDGALHKAQRGELFLGLPPGYHLSEDNVVKKHPDESVRAAVEAVFTTFRETKSSYETLQSLLARGTLVPLGTDRFGRKKVEWRAPDRSVVLRILKNPFYAGAYVFGRKFETKTVTPDGIIETRVRWHKESEWPVLLKGHHEGYITWDEFQANLQRLRNNLRGFGRTGPVQGGPSLIAGMVRCGLCGKSLTVTYKGSGSALPYFICNRNGFQGPRCVAFGGLPLEERVRTLLLSVLEPDGLEAVLIALKDLEAQRTKQARLWDLEVERATELEARCRRKHEEVEPGNRLVARELEQKWEGALRALEEAQRTRERNLAQLPPALTPDEERELRRVIAHVGPLWDAASTTPQDRKEVARLLIHHVDVRSDRDPSYLLSSVHWSTGHVSDERVKLRRVGRPKKPMTDGDLEVIRRMAPAYTNVEIARQLNLGKRICEDGSRWTGWKVGVVLREHGWSKHGPGDLVSAKEAERLSGVDEKTIRRWIHEGRLVSHQPYPEARHRIRREEVLRLARRRRNRKVSSC